MGKLVFAGGKESDRARVDTAATQCEVLYLEENLHTHKTNKLSTVLHNYDIEKKSETDISIGVEADTERVISVHSTGWGVVVRESGSGLQGQLQSLTGEPLACNIIRGEKFPSG